MFIRIKESPQNDELNLIISSIESFTPHRDGGSRIIMNNGSSYIVAMTNRTLRHRIATASAASTSEANTKEDS